MQNIVKLLGNKYQRVIRDEKDFSAFIDLCFDRQHRRGQDQMDNGKKHRVFSVHRRRQAEYRSVLLLWAPGKILLWSALDKYP